MRSSAEIFEDILGCIEESSELRSYLHVIRGSRDAEGLADIEDTLGWIAALSLELEQLDEEYSVASDREGLGISAVPARGPGF